MCLLQPNHNEILTNLLKALLRVILYLKEEIASLKKNSIAFRSVLIFIYIRIKSSMCTYKLFGNLLFMKLENDSNKIITISL